MPTGLPPNLADVSYRLSLKIHEAIAYFEIPALHEVTNSFQIAWKDSILAFQSTSHFLRITFRPLLILLALISRYVYIVLEILARHTVHHAYIGMKESLHQLKIGTKEFIRFQRSLPRFWIGVELGICALLIAGYLLRRFIKKRRYVERVEAWYLKKKRMAQKVIFTIFIPQLLNMLNLCLL